MLTEDQEATFSVYVQVMSGPSYRMAIDTALGECASEGPTPELAALGLAKFIALAVEHADNERGRTPPEPPGPPA